MATYNVTSSPYSAVGDGKLVTDGAMNNDSAVLTSNTASFAAGDVGKKIAVSTNNGAVGMLVTTISSRQSATQVTLAATATANVTNATVLWGTDDSSSIQSALDAAGNAGGGTVYVPTPPSGTRYLVTHAPYTSGNSLACLRIPSNVRVTGDGPSSLIQLLPPTSGAAYDIFASKNSLYQGQGGSTSAAPSVVDSNIRVDQVGLDGSKTLLLSSSLNTAHAFYFSRCGGVEINTVYFANFGSDGAVFEYSLSSSVIGCYSTGQAKTAVYLSGSEAISVAGNVSSGDGDGIYVAASWYCTLSGNVIQGWGPVAGSHAGVWLTRDARYNSVTGNTISKGGGSSNAGIQLYPQALGSPPTLHGVAAGGGADASGQYPYAASFNTVSANTITGNAGIGIYLADYSDFNVVSGNVISGNGSSGVLLQGAQNNHVKANVIINNMTGAIASTAGIRLGSTGAERPTTGNRIYDNDISDYPVYEFTTLAGTSSTTAASSTVAGSGTAYQTDLATGKPLIVPTPGTESYKTIASIPTQTSLSVNTSYGTTASNQTATGPKTSNQITHPTSTQTVSIQEDNLPGSASGAGTVDSNDFFRNKVSGSVTTVGANSRTDLASCRTYASGGATIPTGAASVVSFNTDRWNIGGVHFTSSANLTGTVSKTNGSTTLTGSSSSFLTELSPGQLIDVPTPAGATERRVVTRIVSNTQLIVAAAFGATASGQTATRVNAALVCQSAGLYAIAGNAEFGNSAGGTRRDLQIRLNGTTLIGTSGVPAVNAFQSVNVNTAYRLNRWDYVELLAYQDSGGNLSLSASGNYSPEFMMERLGD